jgi:isochorismate synthase
MPQDFVHKINELIRQKLPFALFSLPNSKTVQLYYQKENTLFQKDTLDFEGFVLAPFEWNKTFDYIPSTFSLTIAKATLTKNVLATATAFSKNEIEDSKKQHLALVNQAIKTIKKGNISKVICSRKEILNTSIDILQTFITMLVRYPFAFNYTFQHPKLGKWLGASPELLLAYEHELLQTVSLAGTQAFDLSKTNYTWRKKERDEQQVVTDFIVNQLKQISNTVSCTKPKTSLAGNVVHLKSEITAKMPKNSLSKALELLHPTPAVCGFPRANALAFIRNNENYNRSYYTGFLGVNSKAKLQLFVNLRCLEITKTVDVYVGGGINSASDAEEEWQETVLKTSVIKGVLRV